MTCPVPHAPSLFTRLGPLELAHPLINASGTLDLFEASACLAGGDDPSALGSLAAEPPVAAYVPKTVTVNSRCGNEPPRIIETAAGMLNSIGLPNRGLEAFIVGELPRLLALPCPVILNVGGFAVEEYVHAARRLRDALDAGATSGSGSSRTWVNGVGLELNVSCPNVHSGCMSIGTDAGETRELVAAVRAVWPGLLVVKLTPNVTDIVPIAHAAVEAGADALSLVNTFKGLAIDRISLRPYLGGVTGGLSGPAIKPLALRFVFEVRAAVDVPLVGMGGVENVQDVIDFLACGASVVAVGAAGFRDPFVPTRLAEDLRAALSVRGLSLGELVGIAHRG
ncbi:MAG: dihydroorotate dehydrogenase [Thermoleophilia bacterium]